MASYRDAADNVQSAIVFGELAAQRAPSGAPIFDALTRARAMAEHLEDQISWYSTTGGDASEEDMAGARRAIDDIYDAAAAIRTDPDAPLAKTTYQQPTRVPWGWIGAGVGAVLATVVYFYRRKRRR